MLTPEQILKETLIGVNMNTIKKAHWDLYPSIIRAMKKYGEQKRR